MVFAIVINRIREAKKPKDIFIHSCNRNSSSESSSLLPILLSVFGGILFVASGKKKAICTCVAHSFFSLVLSLLFYCFSRRNNYDSDNSTVMKELPTEQYGKLEFQRFLKLFFQVKFLKIRRTTRKCRSTLKAVAMAFTPAVNLWIAIEASTKTRNL